MTTHNLFMQLKPTNKTGYEITYNTPDGFTRKITVLAYKADDADMIFRKKIGDKLGYRVKKVQVSSGN